MSTHLQSIVTPQLVASTLAGLCGPRAVVEKNLREKIDAHRTATGQSAVERVDIMFGGEAIITYKA